MKCLVKAYEEFKQELTKMDMEIAKVNLTKEYETMGEKNFEKAFMNYKPLTQAGAIRRILDMTTKDYLPVMGWDLGKIKNKLDLLLL